MAKALARSIHGLSHLSVSRFLDAKDFFADFLPNTGMDVKPIWSNLRTLSLTSLGLSWATSEGSLVSLFKAAASAAMNMPRLEVLEIWNAAGGDTNCIVRYSIKDQEPRLTWRGSWTPGTELKNSLVESWQTVTSYLTTLRYKEKGELTASFDLIWVDGEMSEMLPHLELRDQILHPVSQYQLAWESQNDWRG